MAARQAAVDSNLLNEQRLQRALKQVRYNLTQFIYLLLLENQLAHKIVNLLFTITYQNVQLTASSRGLEPPQRTAPPARSQAGPLQR